LQVKGVTDEQFIVVWRAKTQTWLPIAEQIAALITHLPEEARQEVLDSRVSSMSGGSDNRLNPLSIQRQSTRRHQRRKLVGCQRNESRSHPGNQHTLTSRIPHVLDEVDLQVGRLGGSRCMHGLAGCSSKRCRFFLAAWMSFVSWR
jgi:hypothetical protein